MLFLEGDGVCEVLGEEGSSCGAGWSRSIES